MKKILTAALLSACALTAHAADYQVDPFHTNARFAIDHFNTSTNVGGFYGLEGVLQFDAARKKGTINITIPVANLKSTSPEFENHLKSADLFNAEQHPEMKFTSTKFHFKGKKVVAVDGTLTLLGQTHPVRLKADKFGCYNSPMKKVEVCGADLSTTIDRTKWGMDYLVAAGMSKKVQINIQFEAAKM